MDYSKLSDQDLIALHNKDYSKISDAGLKMLHEQQNPAYNPNRTAENIERIGSGLKEHVPQSVQDLVGAASSSILGHVRGATGGTAIPSDYEKALVPADKKLFGTGVTDQDVEDAGVIQGSPMTALLGSAAIKSPGLAKMVLGKIMPGGGAISKLASLFGRGAPAAAEATEAAAPVASAATEASAPAVEAAASAARPKDWFLKVQKR